MSKWPKDCTWTMTRYLYLCVCVCVYEHNILFIYILFRGLDSYKHQIIPLNFEICINLSYVECFLLLHQLYFVSNSPFHSRSISFHFPFIIEFLTYTLFYFRLVLRISTLWRLTPLSVQSFCPLVDCPLPYLVSVLPYSLTGTRFVFLQAYIRYKIMVPVLLDRWWTCTSYFSSTSTDVSKSKSPTDPLAATRYFPFSLLIPTWTTPWTKNHYRYPRRKD